MADYFSLRNQTLLFAGKDGEPKRLGVSDGHSYAAPLPEKAPTQLQTSIREKLAVWSWQQDSKTPAQVSKIGCRVRNMNMDYNMVMPVCDRITVENVVVTTENARFSLPLTQDFVLDKYVGSGHVPPSSSSLFPLETRMDESLLVVFAYQLKDGVIQSIPQSDVVKLGEKFIPTFQKFGGVTVDEVKKFFVCPLRVLVCVGFTFCKERADFAPGDLVGMFRLYPHVMIMASLPLMSVEGDVVVHRPATSPHGGFASTDDYYDDPNTPIQNLATPVDRMEANLVHELMTDTNGVADLPLPQTLRPYWHVIFDYYDTDPLASGVGFNKPLTVVNSKETRKERSDAGAVVKKTFAEALSTIETEHDIKIVKVARQGEFDNLHIAPRMGLGPVLKLAPSLRTENIAMAPFCVHDCLHTHVRWGKARFSGDGQNGFSSDGVPNSTPLAPMVPPNQTVTLQLLKPAGFRYRFIADGPIIPGHWTLGYHHGLAYAGDIWGATGIDKLAGLRAVIESEGEMTLGGHTATNSWAAFYWRIRFRGSNKPIERIIMPNLHALRAL